MQKFLTAWIFEEKSHLSDFGVLSNFFYLFYPIISADPDGLERKVTIQLKYFILFLRVPLTLILHVYNKILKKKQFETKKKCVIYLSFFVFFTFLLNN